MADDWNPSGASILNPYSAENPLNPTQAEVSPVLDFIIQSLSQHPQARNSFLYLKRQMQKAQNTNLASASYLGAQDVEETGGSEIAPQVVNDPGLVDKIREIFGGTQTPRKMTSQEEYAFRMGQNIATERKLKLAQEDRRITDAERKRKETLLFKMLTTFGAKPTFEYFGSPSSPGYDPDMADIIQGNTMGERRQESKEDMDKDTRYHRRQMEQRAVDNLEERRIESMHRQTQRDRMYDLSKTASDLRIRQSEGRTPYLEWKRSNAEREYNLRVSIAEHNKAIRDRTIDAMDKRDRARLESDLHKQGNKLVSDRLKPFNEEIKRITKVAEQFAKRTADEAATPEDKANAKKAQDYLTKLRTDRDEYEQALRDDLGLQQIGQSPSDWRSTIPAMDEYGLPVAPQSAPAAPAAFGSGVRPPAAGVLPPR
jgi:hypothetical protein